MGKYLLGFEWVGSELKVAAFKKERAKYELFLLDRIKINLAHEKESSEKIREWVESSLPGEEIDAVLTLPESLIFFKELEIPKMPDAELSEAIFWEISSVAPIAPEEAILEWKKISEKEKTVHVSAMVIKNQIADQFLTIFKDAGLNILAIEPSSLAFLRTAALETEKTILLLLVEEEETNVVVLKSGVPVFSTYLSVPLSATRRKKRKLAESVIKTLAESAKKVISFWEAEEKGKIQEVVITGDVARYYGLAKAINQFAHIAVSLAKPKAGKIVTSAQPKATVTRFLVALGAAARLASPELFREVNLFPKEKRLALEKEKAQRDVLRRISTFTRINLAILVVFIILLSLLKFWEALLARQINQSKVLLESHQAQKLIPQVLTINKALGDAQKLVAAQKDKGEKLRQIASLTPAAVALTDIEHEELAREEWKISGIGARSDILAFFEKLKVASGAREISMPYSNLAKERDNEFEVTVKW